MPLLVLKGIDFNTGHNVSYLMKGTFFFSLLVLKGIDFTTGHIFLYSMKGMSLFDERNEFPGWFSKLDSPGRLFSFFLMGMDFTTGHIYFFVLDERNLFLSFLCSPVGFKGNRFHYWTYLFVFDERNEFPRLVFKIGLSRSVIFPCWF